MIEKNISEEEKVALPDPLNANEMNQARLAQGCTLYNVHIKFGIPIKSVGEEYQAVKRGREYRGRGEEYYMEKRERGSNTIFLLILRFYCKKYGLFLEI